MKSANFPLFSPFKPEKSLVNMFHVLFIVIMLVFGGPLLVGAYFSESATFLAACLVMLFAVAGWYLFWVGKYYQTIFFELKDDEVTWKRGVWFRKTGIVPYDRITNIDIYQGPLMRHFGFSSIKLQTAGYSAQARSEITLEGIAAAEELRETIMSLIRESRRVSGSSDATGSLSRPHAPPQSEPVLLGELRAIRLLLERIEKKS